MPRCGALFGVVTLTVVDEPRDRPEWISETIRLVTADAGRRRGELLSRVATASDDELARGSDDDWGLGQVVVHLLLVDRGVALIALRLALGQSAVGPTGQPRPAGGSPVREGIAALAEKAAAAHARLRAEFPAAPDLSTTAPHPYYGTLNCFGWLLTLGNHYGAHLNALDEGTATAL